MEQVSATIYSNSGNSLIESDLDLFRTAAAIMIVFMQLENNSVNGCKSINRTASTRNPLRL